MSESTANQRIEILKNILLKLHHGTDPESVQDLFNEHFTGVSAIEISLMEHQLMNSDTGITFEDVMKLCNVHANLFKQSIDGTDIAQADLPGHPVRVFKDENLAIQAAFIRVDRILKAIKSTLETQDNIDAGLLKGLQHQVTLLGQFDNHYTRKEKLFFPHMERYGHTSPPKVMWGVDDDIRDMYKDFSKAAHALPDNNIDKVIQLFQSFEHEFKEMIFKEESILLNILLETLTEDDWYQIAQESDTYGYCLISQPEEWVPERHDFAAIDLDHATKGQEGDLSNVSVSDTTSQQAPPSSDTYIKVPGGRVKLDFIPDGPESHSTVQSRDQQISFKDAGTLSLREMELILNHLPLEVTFVNKDDIFQYFNQAVAHKDMIFPRTPSQIGRHIELCHPPMLWPKVKKLIEELRDGVRAQESLWFKKGDKFIFITYRALHDDTGEFMGILETVQDIQPFRDIDQEVKRNISDPPSHPWHPITDE